MGSSNIFVAQFTDIGGRQIRDSETYARCGTASEEDRMAITACPLSQQPLSATPPVSGHICPFMLPGQPEFRLSSSGLATRIAADTCAVF